MTLLLSKYIENHELKHIGKQFNIDDLLKGSQKILKGLSKEIVISRSKNPYRFFKVRIGKKVKGRMIVFVISEKKIVVPLIIRLKKDKKTGSNMSAQNNFVVKQLNKNLKHVLKDIKQKAYKEWNIKF